MKSIATDRYTAAFWNTMKNRKVENFEDATLGQTSDTSLVLPTGTEVKFKQEQERNNIFRSLATVLSVNAENRVKTMLPAGDAAFIADGAAIPEATVGLTNWVINPHKVAKMTKLTNETLKDSGFDLESALAADFGRAFGSVEENGIINGDGVSQPYGLLQATAGALTGTASAAAGTINADDIRSLYFSLDRKYRRNSAWVMSDETALLLRTLKDDDGNYLWNEATETLLSKPVYTSPYMPNVADGAKPVPFGDFSYYWFVARGAVTLQPIHELYAENGITAYIASEYVDGKLIRQDAVKALAVA